MKSRTLFLAGSAVALATVPTFLAGACSAIGGGTDFDTGGSTGSSASTNQGGAGTGGEPNLFDGGKTDGGGSDPGADPTTCEEAAANRTYIGCDFWPTVVANVVWSIFDFAVVVANTGAQPADVTVTRNGQTIATQQVGPNSLSTVYLPWVPELKGQDSDECGSAVPLSATVRSNGGAYHLVSTRPVTVYQFSALEYAPQGGPPGKNWGACPAQFCGLECFSYTNDASLLLPSTAMTGNYRITGKDGWELANIGPYFAVTGTADNTSVTVQLSQTGQVLGGGGVPPIGPGGQATFNLNAGDVVEVVGDAYSDLSGSLVKATAPVQVITGMPCVNVPDDFYACDHIEESVFPAETLGKHYFVTVPTSPNNTVVGHLVRIYGNVNGTALTYPGGAPPGAPTSINAGQVVQLDQVSQDFEILGDHEFAVGTFQFGAQLVDPNGGFTEQKGDPAQSLATAVEQYRTKYVFLAPSDYPENYVDIVMPAGAQVNLDGAALTVPVKPLSSNYSIARVPLGPGNNGAHTIVANTPVGIQVMGYGSYTSYQYPGGLNLGTIAPPPPLQ
jgi:hypothetical protein